MEVISKLPEKNFIVGSHQIARAAKEGKIKYVVIAKNCPDSLAAKITGVKVDKFDGDESQLGTKLGKPFPVAMVGFEE